MSKQARKEFKPDWAAYCEHNPEGELKCCTGKILMAILKERDDYIQSLTCCGNCKWIRDDYDNQLCVNKEHLIDEYGSEFPCSSGYVTYRYKGCKHWEDNNDKNEGDTE